MELVAETVGEIIAALRQEQPTNDRQRRGRRVPVSEPAELIPFDGGRATCPPSPASLRDLSATGAGLQQERRVDVGQRVLLRLAAGEQSTLTVVCVVVHCQPKGRAFHVGLKFESFPFVGAS